MRDAYDSVTVRPAELADMPAIGALRRLVARETYSAYDPQHVADWADERHSDQWIAAEFDGPHDSLMLAAVSGSGHVVGTAYAQRKPSSHHADSYFGGLYLHRHARRKGIGTGLLTGCLRWLASRGASRVACEAAHDNTPALRALHAAGFVERDRKPFAPIAGLLWVELVAPLDAHQPTRMVA